MRRLAILLTLLAGCASPGQQPEDILIPVGNADGSATSILGHVCRPSGPAAAPLVVIAHGSPPRASDRPTMRLTPCTAEAPRWFLARGFAVAVALRRGYGPLGGPYYESSTPCTADNFVRAARESARDVQAVIDYATALPGIQPEHVIVVGQSAGGWAALGLNSLPHPRVAAIVSMAGGRGGHYHQMPNQNCGAENLEAAAGMLARTASTPMLWIYTENDSYFAPPIAQAMYAQFTGAGGAAELHQLGPFRQDGHALFFGRDGSAIWGPLIEQYLRERGVMPAQATP